MPEFVRPAVESACAFEVAALGEHAAEIERGLTVTELVGMPVSVFPTRQIVLAFEFGGQRKRGSCLTRPTVISCSGRGGGFHEFGGGRFDGLGGEGLGLGRRRRASRYSLRRRGDISDLRLTWLERCTGNFAVMRPQSPPHPSCQQRQSREGASERRQPRRARPPSGQVDQQTTLELRAT